LKAGSDTAKAWLLKTMSKDDPPGCGSSSWISLSAWLAWVLAGWKLLKEPAWPKAKMEPARSSPEKPSTSQRNR